jgi:hypothetical protein
MTAFQEMGRRPLAMTLPNATLQGDHGVSSKAWSLWLHDGRGGGQLHLISLSHHRA